MTAQDFQDVWYNAMSDTFDIFPQVVVWNGKRLQAVVDGLPQSDAPHHGGGGFGEDFSGHVTFHKADFTDKFPTSGDIVHTAGRKLRLVIIENRDDATDPTIQCSYVPHAA